MIILIKINMKKNTFFEKIAAPEPIHLMTEVTSILDSICKCLFCISEHPEHLEPEINRKDLVCMDDRREHRTVDHLSLIHI